jgi:hypothetical protein
LDGGLFDGGLFDHGRNETIQTAEIGMWLSKMTSDRFPSLPPISFTQLLLEEI